MKTFLECMQLGAVVAYFFLYKAALAVEKIFKFICWWTVVPVFCITLMVAEKIKIIRNYISETSRFKKMGRERAWIKL